MSTSFGLLARLPGRTRQAAVTVHTDAGSCGAPMVPSSVGPKFWSESMVICTAAVSIA